MSKSLIRIVETVREELSNYHITDDNEMPFEYLVDKTNDMRQVLLKEEFKQGNIDQRYYQRVCCLEVFCHRHGCTVDGIFIPSSEITWEVKLPKLVNGVDWKNILYFGTDEFRVETNWTRKNLEGWINLEGNLYSSTMPAFVVIGNTAWIKNAPTSDLKYLCAVLLLYDPVEACNWDNDTSEYPVPDDYKLQLLIKKDILSTYGLPKDKQNDGTDTIPAQINPSQNE